jgi:hypothetical protein
MERRERRSHLFLDIVLSLHFQQQILRWTEQVGRGKTEEQRGDEGSGYPCVLLE